MTTIHHVWSGDITNPENARRNKLAVQSWCDDADALAASELKVLIHLNGTDYKRDATSIGEKVHLPFVHDMIERAMDKALDTDIVVITNSDVGVVRGFYSEVAEVCAKHGACYAYRWDFPRLDEPLTTKEQVKAGKWYVGSDMFSFTKKWWLANRHDYPDFVLGRECWDWILRALITETKGVELLHAIFHEKHESPWKQNRSMNTGNIYNRSYARAWLEHHKMPLREIANAPYVKVAWPSDKGVPAPDANGMDILIVLGTGSKWQNNELRYCLRGIERFAKGVNKVWIVGQDPGFLSSEANLHARPDAGTNKEHRIAEQVCWAAKNLPLTEKFLWMNDDFFFLKDTDITTYPYYQDGSLEEKWKKIKPNGYRIAIMQTDAQLRGKKLPTVNYEQHVPITYTRSGLSKLGKWLEMSSKVPTGLTWRSIYCNVLGVTPGPQYRDMKIGNCANAADAASKVVGRHVFSIGDGWTEDAKGFFKQLFPNKSKYEA